MLGFESDSAITEELSWLDMETISIQIVDHKPITEEHKPITEELIAVIAVDQWLTNKQMAIAIVEQADITDMVATDKRKPVVGMEKPTDTMVVGIRANIELVIVSIILEVELNIVVVVPNTIADPMTVVVVLIAVVVSMVAIAVVVEQTEIAIEKTIVVEITFLLEFLVIQ
jgi:hypothetical protein